MEYFLVNCEINNVGQVVFVHRDPNVCLDLAWEHWAAERLNNLKAKAQQTTDEKTLAAYAAAKQNLAFAWLQMQANPQQHHEFEPMGTWSSANSNDVSYLLVSMSPASADHVQWLKETGINLRTVDYLVGVDSNLSQQTLAEALFGQRVVDSSR